ncbi:helix-turn-helix protein [Streptoalloteichus tenebrarius]|uniref:Helix-turn-helix protein n=1 Tax=Streptoalloteichus tenebrarius (strain ATCC 17920 / DSM 40477 / JCM 4838 / CBS 697.72 / NBRC 16177 / NCIMB 11028 / NRRL B-12390 / A12253. 1 / ISP 5477) TaxID=1933 RepID=A0ABT1HRN9_STRSD|nr:helix-turn-helix transcriptional regulator [Streptoalloteichus tenebrarius]MCP2258182.1 helix-turn-helix protein [Streptoalloteichus tenebrarius]BFF04592.1 helix-turn-helix transcriptional regulator [Streptoalloteichus tenebrarius]
MATNTRTTARRAEAAPSHQRPVGELIREWRQRRRLSQLELSLQAEISTRHLSFLETGRSRPTSEMILRITERLDVPLRERNRMLLAGGHAPVYPERGMEAPEMDAVRAALRQVLGGHEPYPAVVVDQGWTMIDANAGLALFTEGVAPELLAPPVNVMRLSLHPDGVAPRIANLGEWRAHLLGRLRRQIAVTGDARLSALYEELRSYPCDQPEPEMELPGPGEVVVPLHFRHGGQELVFLSITAVFGTPLDVTVSELAIESFFPANPETGAALRAWFGDK